MIFNKENIVKYLHNNSELMLADSNKLEQFVEQYPYSGLLQLIYCKFLHLHNDIRLEKQLEKCALVVSDRKKVYEILFQKNLQQEIIKHESKLVDNSIIEIEEIEVLPIQPIVEVKTEKTKNKLDELEQNILNEAINSSIQIDISEYLKEEEIQPEYNSEIEKDEIIEEKERSFLNWFDKPIEKKEKKSKSSLIDDFLKTSKRKNNISTEILSPSEMAKMSLVANNQFVTETLATIYAKQGQIDKAIEIYEQLSLKNPEKKAFFASRIRFLKEKQQYNK